jgi:xanthine dehydrogenase accessory factor
MTAEKAREQARTWLAAGLPAAVVDVIGSQGSVPREAGTRMLVSATEVVGTIGGGHLELKAIAAARSLIADFSAGASPGPIEQHFALGPTLGQCCGGAVTLRSMPLQQEHLDNWPLPASRLHLQLYGAGHVGRAIVQLLAGLPCQVQWIDERESEFPRQLALPPHIEKVCVEPVEAEVASAPPGAFYLVLTHSHDLDLAIAQNILRRGDFGFFGLIGSKSKRTRFIRRFEQRGIDEEAINRMTCPIGLSGIVGKEPEVIALAVVAQLMQAAAAAGSSGGARLHAQARASSTTL